MERDVLSKVSETISTIDKAKRVDDVILALHSLATHLFAVDTISLSGVISERYRVQLENVEISSGDQRRDWWKAFYHGLAFPTLAKVLLHDVASSWLSCIPHSARKAVYDVFFVSGLLAEVIQVVIPYLEHKSQDGQDAKAVRSNAERLVELCLLENQGIWKIAREFGGSHISGNFTQSLVVEDMSRAAQLLASIPDKAMPGAPKFLSSHLFFKHVMVQLLKAAEERNKELADSAAVADVNEVNGTFQFIGDMFARICRRGSADLVVSILIPQVLERVRKFVSLDEEISENAFMSEQRFTFWFQMVKVVRDPYAVERLAEKMLHQLANEHARDVEAYWILWMLFSQLLDQPSVRFMFFEKFLLWKVFPLCCLRWILQFVVLGCPPVGNVLAKGKDNSGLLDAAQRLSAVWSKQDFVQSAPVEQQIYITAALGLLMEKMSKEELDSTKNVMKSVLDGVSCRLENPSDLIRRMASNIALVFSKVIDPEKPLYLDDRCTNDDIDWETRGVAQERGALTTVTAVTSNEVVDVDSSRIREVGKQQCSFGNDERTSIAKIKSRKSSQHKFVDPDEIIDPSNLYEDEAFVSDGDEDDSGSECSEASSDSSLQPYDLTDDDTDLSKKLTHLVDVVGALRKTDDPDGVERALDIAENLVQASPYELRHIAGNLVRALVQVRCSDTTVDGEEDSAEEKRQNALVSLLVACPFESVETISKLLYSSHVDVSQRIIIIDAMTSAAEELANTKTIKQKHQSRPLISTNETQPWFLPSSKGPFGAGPWKEIADKETPLNWSYRYERELPSNPDRIVKGKTRRWSSSRTNIKPNEVEWSTNKFPLYAAAFMLPVMHGFDKRSHGVDLLGRDFIVLGKLIYMLGVCMKCTALHPEASALASPLLDMLSCREVFNHKEAYVRRSALFAASCTLMALHPSYIASALFEGNQELSRSLDWIHTWALQVTESDTDRECYTMAMACLQLHAQMSLQAARALESVESASQTKIIELPSNMMKMAIKIPDSRSLLLS